MSSNSRATLRFVSRAASSRPAFVAEEIRHVYTSVLLDMHYSVVQYGPMNQFTSGTDAFPVRDIACAAGRQEFRRATSDTPRDGLV